MEAQDLSYLIVELRLWDWESEPPVLSLKIEVRSGSGHNKSLVEVEFR